MSDRRVSVVVVGGGPTGAVAARRLARAGVDVLVIDRPRPGRIENAEILSPEGRQLLDAEGLWGTMPSAFAMPCTMLGVAWETPEADWTSFLRHPYGVAWHLDRIRFDAWMLGEVEAAGATVVSGVVDRVQREADGWLVEFVASDDGSRGSAPRADVSKPSVRARVVIQATGRADRAVRLAPRERIDNLCLVIGTASPDPIHTDALIVEAVEDGWWYSAPLVDGRLFAGWMTDFSLVSGGRYVEAARASLVTAPIHARRLADVRLSAMVSAAAWAMTPAAGTGWIALGDAALARDPIGGDGLTAALRAGCEGADVVQQALGGDAAVWSTAAIDSAQRAGRYIAQRLELYRRAQPRWPASPFWRRFGAGVEASLAAASHDRNRALS